MEIIKLKRTSVLFASTAMLACLSLHTQAATMITRFISTPNDSSTLKQSVQGCDTTSVNITKIGYNTVVNLYDNGSFELGYDDNLDGDLNDAGDDILILTGIWSAIDASATKFRFQPDGDLGVSASNGGWGYIYTWTTFNGCISDTDNDYLGTYRPTFRILKSDMTLNTSSNTGTLQFTLEGYGETTASVATPPTILPKMKYEMKAKGGWYSPPTP